MMRQGHISVPDWTAGDFLPIVACWVVVGLATLMVSILKPMPMPKPLRIGLAAACGLFAAIVGAGSMLMIFGELTQGQPHGPSPLWLGLLCLPFAILASAVTRWIRRLPDHHQPAR